MALPRSEMALLQPSTTLGSSKKTRREVEREVHRSKMLRGERASKSDIDGEKVMDGEGGSYGGSVLTGTAWRRKKRKRRKLRVEKVMQDPKVQPVDGEGGEDGESESSGEEEDEERDSTGECVCLG